MMSANCVFSVICLALAGLLSAGCQGALGPQGVAALTSGYQAYQAGDNELTVRKMDDFLRDYPKGPRRDEALVLRGMARYNLKDLGGAKSDLQEALAAARWSSTRAKAFYNLANVAYDMNDMPLAVESCRQVVAAAGGDAQAVQLVAQAHYRLGTALQRQGKWTEADAHFHRAGHLAGDSDLAHLAAGRVNCRAWSVQAGAYGSKASADAAAARLRQNSLGADVKADRLPTPRYIVQVGRFETFEMADQALREVKKLQDDAFVVTTE